MFKFDYYLAGPMRGYKKMNAPLFNKVAEMLRNNGHTVFNPAEVNDEDLSFEECMVVDINAVVNECENIAILKQWRESLGSNVEVFVAFAIGKSVYEIDIDINPGFVTMQPVDINSYDLPYKRNGAVN